MPNLLSPTTLQAFGILVREGLEAILIIAILAAYLRKSGAQRHIGALYLGAAAAVVASVALAWVFQTFNHGMHADWLEAVTMLAAATLLFYVSGWLYVKKDPTALQKTLKAKAQQAVSQGTLFAMASVAFFSVLREGAETILMLYGVLATDPAGASRLLTGGVAACAVLLVLFAIIQKATIRLPLKPIFMATSAFLFLTGLHFVLSAVTELQEMSLLGFSPVLAGSSLTWQAIFPVFLILNLAAGGIAIHAGKPKSRS